MEQEDLMTSIILAGLVNSPDLHFLMGYKRNPLKPEEEQRKEFLRKLVRLAKEAQDHIEY